jgi:hypothetical protein
MPALPWRAAPFLMILTRVFPDDGFCTCPAGCPINTVKPLQTRAAQPLTEPEKKTCFLAKLLIGLGLPLVTMSTVAQDIPRYEVYLGYSLVRVAPPENVNAFNSNGGLGSIQYNLGKNLGIVAEFGDNANGEITVRKAFPGDQTQFSYLFGPRFFANKAGRVSPFANFLFGGMHNSRGLSVPNSYVPVGWIRPSGLTVEPGAAYTKIRSTQNAFAMAIGGGTRSR